MRISRNSLNILIKDMLFEQVERAQRRNPAADIAGIVATISGLSSSRVTNLILSGGSGAAAAGNVSEFARSGLQTVVSDILGGVRVVGPLLLIAAMWEVFTFLPKMMQAGLDRLETVEGLLIKMRELHRRPIRLSDITNTPSQTIYTSKTWSRDQMVDYIAINMELPEGRALFGHLVASEYRGESNQRMTGPIIDQEFANAIQKRRKTIKEEAGEKIKEALIAKIKAGEVSEENLLKLKDAITSIS